mgnify:CR=1 FL=1
MATLSALSRDVYQVIQGNLDQFKTRFRPTIELFGILNDVEALADSEDQDGEANPFEQFLPRLQTALAGGALVNCNWLRADGATPMSRLLGIMRAAPTGEKLFWMIDGLLQYHADPNSVEPPDVPGSTGCPLLCCIVQNEGAYDDDVLEMVGYCLEYGADVNLPDDRGMTALMISLSLSMFNVAELLLESGAHVVVGERCVSEFIFHGDIVPLVLNLRFVTKLLRYVDPAGQQIDVNGACDEDGNTLLMYSCRYPEANELTRFLIEEMGADVTALSKRGNSALHSALTNYWNILDASVDTVGLLLNNGAIAIINERDDRGYTCMSYAIEICLEQLPWCYLPERRSALLTIIEMLLAVGGDANAIVPPPSPGRIPLCNYELPDEAMCIDYQRSLEKGYTTLLMTLCNWELGPLEGRKIGLVRVLVEACGADVRMKNASGHTALDIAAADPDFCLELLKIIHGA